MYSMDSRLFVGYEIVFLVRRQDCGHAFYPNTLLAVRYFSSPADPRWPLQTGIRWHSRWLETLTSGWLRVPKRTSRSDTTPHSNLFTDLKRSPDATLRK